MPVKNGLVKESFLRSTPLPTHGQTYTVIPHGTIVDNTIMELQAAGFSIDKTYYRSTQNGNIAQGEYHLNCNEDPEMKMMFAWTNSYDKSRRFQCSVGSIVHVCMNGMIHGDMGNATRKHTGSALQDAIGFIQYQISMGERKFKKLVEDREHLKTVILTRKQKGEVVGRLFADDEVLTLTQLGIVQREMKKPSFQYNADQDSAWYLYNHITHALKASHPSKFMDDHMKVHSFFVNEFGILVNKEPVVEPVQQLELELEEATSTVLFL